MTPLEGLQDWSVYHGDIFALTTKEDARMLLVWCELFLAEGYTPEELTEASKWLAMNDPPQFRSEHLAGLTGRVREQRRQTELRSPTIDERDHGKCELCAGCGFVSVPGAGCLTAGGSRIPYNSTQTVAVFCSCAVGCAKLRGYTGNTPQRSLADYQREFPHWKHERRRLDLLPLKRAQVQQHTMGLDKALGSILAKVRAQVNGVKRP
jgi:hypothetical protein